MFCKKSERWKGSVATLEKEEEGEVRAYALKVTQEERERMDSYEGGYVLE